MVGICTQILRMTFNGSIFLSNASNPFECFEFRFEIRIEFFESLSSSNLDSNPLTPFRIAFECFESYLKCLNLHSNALNPFRMVRICNQILRIPFKWIEFETLLYSWNLPSTASNSFRMERLHSNASNLIWIVRLWIRILQIPFEGLEFTFERFETLSNRSSLHSNTSNLFEWFEFAFKCFKFLSNGSNLQSNASNSF